MSALVAMDNAHYNQEGHAEVGRRMTDELIVAFMRRWLRRMSPLDFDHRMLSAVARRRLRRKMRK